MSFNKYFIKGAVLGVLVYIVFNLFSLLLALPILLGYYFALVFALIGGLLYYLYCRKRK